MDADKLLHTKLMPPRLPATVVARSILLTRLDHALTNKLTIVSAPTGFGKSTLVSMWISERKIRAVWLALDENDNDPVRFWTYVIMALRTLDASVGKTALAALMAPQPGSFHPLLTSLINDMAHLDDDFVLVLEDYHVITSPEINETVTYLLQHLPGHLHLILISRNEPNLPLPILRMRDQLLEINAPSMRFTIEETASFLRMVFGSDLPSSAAPRLQQRTDGWAAGLRLMTLALKNAGGTQNVERFIGEFSGEHRYVADYLVEEVFPNQPETIQLFLLKTCFLSRLTGSLCDSVTKSSGGESMLQRLERDNLFLVQLDSTGRRAWYRYSPYFAESIQVLARQRLAEEDVLSIFERASTWYEYQQLFEDSIETALTAKLFERAIRLIEKYIGIHNLSELLTLGRWLEQIPRDEILLHPTICFAYAQVILYTSDRFAPATAIQIEPLLYAAETAWRDQANHQGIGEVLSFRGNVALWLGDFQKAFKYAHGALGELPEHDALYIGSSLIIVGHENLSAGRVLEAQDIALQAQALLGAVQNIYGVLAALQILGDVSYWQCELEQAEQLNRQILAQAVGDTSMLDDQGVANLNLARIAYERNDLEAASQFTAQALGLSQQRGNEQLEVQATKQHAYIFAAKNDLASACAVLKSLMTRVHIPVLAREIQDTLARFSILRGDLPALKSSQTSVSSGVEYVMPLQKEREAFTLARQYIAEGKSSEALEKVSVWKDDAVTNGRLRSHVEALCVEALAYQATANDSQATALLIHALTIGHAKGLRRIFLDEGARMTALLQAVLPALPNRTLSHYATTLIHSFNPGLILPGSPVLVEPLSKQELRVLHLLLAGLSRSDIARELVVSANTIKSQVQSIYRKLNVSSREEAGEVARELNLH